jgi:hypothetical protein
MNIVNIQDTARGEISKFIRTGNKTAVGLPATRANLSIQPRDILRLRVGDNAVFACRVNYIRKYRDILDYLCCEGLEITMPCARSPDAALAQYSQWFTDSEIDDIAAANNGVGFLGIGIEDVEFIE